MFRKPQIVGIMFVIAVFALIATGIKSPVTGADFEKLTEEEATARWMTSGHADADSEAFRHWDEDDPAVISTSCAKCHSTDGFEEFIATGGVATEHSAANNIGVECTVCHSNATTGALRGITSVTFPSATALSSSSSCDIMIITLIHSMAVYDAKNSQRTACLLSNELRLAVSFP